MQISLKEIIMLVIVGIIIILILKMFAGTFLRLFLELIGVGGSVVSP